MVGNLIPLSFIYLFNILEVGKRDEIVCHDDELDFKVANKQNYF